MRRTYYIRIEVREYHGPDQAGPPVIASKTLRAPLGIFCVNEWREIVRSEINLLGFDVPPDMGQWARCDCREWDHLAFVYGTFNKDGHGRSGSQLWRIPTKRTQAA